MPDYLYIFINLATFIVIVCFPDCDVINFEIYLNFLIKPFFNITKNVRTKIYISSERRVFKMKQKTLLIIFKGLSLKQIKSTSLEGESLTLINFFSIWNHLQTYCFLIISGGKEINSFKYAYHLKQNLKTITEILST